VYVTLKRYFAKDEPVPFPGTKRSYNAKRLFIGSDHAAEIVMHLCTRLEVNHGWSGSIIQIAADHSRLTWKFLWTHICAYFGMYAAEPREDELEKFTTFLDGKRENWMDLKWRRRTRLEGIDSIAFMRVCEMARKNNGDV